MALAFLHHLRTLSPWLLLLSLLGLVSLTKFSVGFLRSAYAYLLRPAKDLRRCYGSWAVVTGATDGIGKAVAFELARKGLNLVLVGRNPDKLRHVSESISNEFARLRIKNVVFDLSGDVEDGIFRLREAIEGLDVGVLVNNAGVAEPSARFFHEVEIELWMKIIKVNLEALTAVTRAVLPGMLERRRGAVLNVGSGSTVAISSFPLFSVYAATKGFVAQLSKSLHVEYKDRGIDVQCQAPLFVETKMISGMKRFRWYSLYIPSSNSYARIAVQWIGYEPICLPHWLHFIQWYLFSLLPNSILDEVLLYFTLTIRKRAERRFVKIRKDAQH